MNRTDILMIGLNKAIPTGGKTEHSINKWRSVAETLDETLLEYESELDPTTEERLVATLASNDGLNPREMAQQIVKELARMEGSRIV